MKTLEEIFDEAIKAKGLDIVSVKDADLYEAALDAIKKALTIPVVVGQSEQFPQPDCHFYDEEKQKWFWAYSKELIDSLR